MRRVLLIVAMAAGAWPVLGAIPAERPTVIDVGARGVSEVAGTWLQDGRPIDGVLVEHDGTGALRMQVRLSQGKPEGVEHRWYGNGQRESLRFYRDGRKIGRHLGWWPDGGRRFEATHVDDAFDGEARTWHASGQLFELRHYHRGREEGLQRSWSPDGVLFLNYEVRHGRRFGFVNAKPCTPVTGGM